MQTLTTPLRHKFHAQLQHALADQQVNLAVTQSHLRVPASKEKAVRKALRRMNWRMDDHAHWVKPDGSWPLRLVSCRLFVVASTSKMPGPLDAIREISDVHINENGVAVMLCPTGQQITRLLVKATDPKVATPVASIPLPSFMIDGHKFTYELVGTIFHITVWPPVRSEA